VRIHHCIAVLLVMLLAGCAAFRDGANPPITAWPPQGSVKVKTIALQVSGKAIVNDAELEMNAKILGEWMTHVFRAYESSGLFSSVKPGTEQADIYADVKITDKGEASIAMAVLTGLTLYLIPSSGHDCFRIRTTYKDKSGTILGSVDKVECSDFWQQLFLLPVMFFNSPFSVPGEILFDLNRNTILESRAKGLF
jgi:hypothetical protein